jgi:hypothetical protein
MLDNPESKYLKTTIGTALYGLCKYRNNHSYRAVHEDYKKIEGNSQQLFYFLKKIEDKELNVLALNYLWKIHQQYPDDKYISDITYNIFHDMVFEHGAKPEEFQKTLKDSIAEYNNISEEEYKKLNKYEKIKIKRAKELGKTQFAFVELFKDKKFSLKFDELAHEYKKTKEDEAKVLSHKEQKEIKRKEMKESRLIHRKGEALGIDRIVVVNPFYIKRDETKRTEMRFIDSENSKEELIERLSKNGKLASLDLEILNINKLNPSEINKYNDYSLLNNWFSEKLDHDDKNILVSKSDLTNELINKYKTKYFAWTGIYTLKEPKSGVGYFLCCTALLVYALPYGIYYALSPENNTFFFFNLYNIETGELVFNEYIYVDAKDRDDILNSYIFSTLFQIKNKR